MHAALEWKESGELWVALTGEGDSLQGAGEAGGPVQLEETVLARRPRKVRIDFRGLSFIDSSAFRPLAEQVDRIRRRVPLELAGPGPALERLFALLGQPAGWSWVNEGPAPAAAEPAAGTPAEGAFEIDLDRELLLRESEPPAIEHDPMAEPLDLSPPPGGWPPVEAESRPEAGPGEPLDPSSGAGPASEDLQLSEGALDSGPDLLLEGTEGGLEEDRAEENVLGGSLPDLLLAGSGAAPRGPAWDPFPAPAERVLQERVIAAILGEERLRARVRELEAERLWLLHRIEEITGRGPPWAPPSPVSLARETLPAGGTGPASGSAGTSAASSSIPACLRGDVERARIVQAFGRLLEARRAQRAIPVEGLGRIAVALSSAVERAPFATFDLAQAEAGQRPEALAIHATAMAVCMAARAGARSERLRRLAAASLLWTLLGPSGDPLVELAGEEAASRALARRVRERLQALSKAIAAPVAGEREVLEDLQLVSLVRGFFRAIGPGPKGGMSPASAALALSRGEIARRAPARLRRLFLETFSAFPPGSWVRLASGEVGVVVGPGAAGVRGPLVLSLFSSGERELRARPPRLVDTGREAEAQVRAVVGSPMRRLSTTRDLLRVGTGVAVK
jgi:hypothetical protein